MRDQIKRTLLIVKESGSHHEGKGGGNRQFEAGRSTISLHGISLPNHLSKKFNFFSLAFNACLYSTLF